MNTTNIITSLNVNTQLPLDFKTYVYDKNELIDLGLNQTKAFTYYIGMNVYCALQQEVYIWREYVTLNELGGLIPNGFTYPNGIQTLSYNYSNKKFNFFIVENNSSINLELIINDSLLGNIDGINNIFTINNNIVPDSESLFVNGIKLTKPNDYNITGSIITTVFSPEINEIININYIKQ